MYEHHTHAINTSENSKPVNTNGFKSLKTLHTLQLLENLISRKSSFKTTSTAFSTLTQTENKRRCCWSPISNSGLLYRNCAL